MHKYSKNIDYSFIVRVLDCKVSPEEKEYFEQWLSESEKNKELFSQISLILDKIETSSLPPLPNPNIQWEKISSKINMPEREFSSQNSKIEKRSEQSRTYYIDNNQVKFWENIFSSRLVQFALLLLIVSSVAIYFSGNMILDKLKSKIQTVNYISEQKEVKTGKGEKLSITLSDGSVVHLNTLSKLTFPEFFADNSREVYLEGEGYFSVTPDKNKPFKVHSGKTVTVVTGTEFDIKYRGQLINVVVAKGSVNTYKIDDEKIYKLKKGDMLSINEKTGFANPQKANLNHFLAWRHNKFSFKRTPLLEVMDEVERYFNIKTRFQSDSLKQITLTGEFRSESLGKVLSIIGLTLDLKISYSNRTVTINKN